MKVFEIPGRFAPSRLAAEIRAAGIDCQGVTATEDSAGVVTAVQVVCGDTATKAAVQTVCNAHDPLLSDPNLVGAANAATLRDRADTALVQLENGWTNWATLTPAQKDGLAKLNCRVNAALIRLALGRLDAT